jgi:hypothetical protein
MPTIAIGSATRERLAAGAVSRRSRCCGIDPP